MIENIKVLIPLIAGILGLFWALYKFYYKEKQRKKLMTSHLIIRSKMVKLGEKGNFHIVKCTIDIINKSKTKMYVLSDYINVYGVTMQPVSISAEAYTEKSNTGILNNNFAYLPRYVELKDRHIAFSGKIFDYYGYWWLEPGEKLQSERIVYLPDSFDFTELSAKIYYSSNKDWIRVKTVSKENESGLSHIDIVNTGKFKGKNFDWNNKKHIKLQSKYKNAEISDSSLLFLK